MQSYTDTPIGMRDSFMEQVGRRLAALRAAEGWSQAEVARRIEASREIVGKYERGEATASLEMARRLADLFDVSLDYLTGAGGETPLDDEMAARLREVAELDEETRAFVLHVVDALVRDAKTRRMYGAR